MQGSVHYDTYDLVLIDDPAPGVRRITLNRPEKHNALNHPLRGQLLQALREGDQDRAVRVQIVRGAGPSFSAGSDLAGGNEGQELPWYTPGGDGHWPRHVTEGWMSIWDLAKPVIAQVHGYCLAGGSELATGCDLVYCADDAKIGYPAVRFGVPDMHFHAWFMGMRTAMEMMVTGDSISGAQAAELGWANKAVPIDALVVELVARVVDRVEAVDDLVSEGEDLGVADVELQVVERLGDAVQHRHRVGAAHLDDRSMRRRVVVDRDLGDRDLARASAAT